MAYHESLLEQLERRGHDFLWSIFRAALARGNEFTVGQEPDSLLPDSPPPGDASNVTTN